MGLYLCNFEVRWESHCDSGSSWNLKEHKKFGYIEWMEDKGNNFILIQKWANDPRLTWDFDITSSHKILSG